MDWNIQVGEVERNYPLVDLIGSVLSPEYAPEHQIRERVTNPFIYYIEIESKIQIPQSDLCPILKAIYDVINKHSLINKDEPILSSAYLFSNEDETSYRIVFHNTLVNRDDFKTLYDYLVAYLCKFSKSLTTLMPLRDIVIPTRDTIAVIGSLATDLAYIGFFNNRCKLETINPRITDPIYSMYVASMENLKLMEDTKLVQEVSIMLAMVSKTRLCNKAEVMDLGTYIYDISKGSEKGERLWKKYVPQVYHKCWHDGTLDTLNTSSAATIEGVAIKDNTLNMETLHYWTYKDNPQLYRQHIKGLIDEQIKKCIAMSGSEYDIGILLHILYRGIFATPTTGKDAHW